MFLFGLFLSMLVGLSLGLLGGGGSILTVPILHYAFGLDARAATSVSLAVVGFTAGLGAIAFALRKEVAFREGLLFALPSFVSVSLIRRYVVPALPARFGPVGFEVSRDTLFLCAFAVVMLLAGLAMLRSSKGKARVANPETRAPLLRIGGSGFVVGVLTGFLGAGGGFLIVPALTLFMGFDMRRAVGTSLLIISANTLTGFGADLMANVDIPWRILASVLLAAGVGMTLGTWAAKRVPAAHLKPAFGIFVVAMAVLILAKELLL